MEIFFLRFNLTGLTSDLEMQFVTINGEQFVITKAVLAVDGNGKPYAGPDQTGTDPNIILVNGEGFRIQQAVVACGGDGQPLGSI